MRGLKDRASERRPVTGGAERGNLGGALVVRAGFTHVQIRDLTDAPGRGWLVLARS